MVNMGSTYRYFMGLYHKSVRFHSFLVDLSRLLTQKKLCSSDSYYPEYSEKSKKSIRVFVEQLLSLFRYGAVNYSYFQYGFDIKGFRNQNDYVNNEVFFYRRNYIRDCVFNSYQTSILRDKLAFYTYLSILKFPTPAIVGVIRNGKLVKLSGNENMTLSKFVREKNFNGFVKAIDGECGRGVNKICLSESNSILINDKVASDDEIDALYLDNEYIVQNAIKNQHPAISKIHPHAINTIRIVTVYDKKRCDYVVLPPILRMGVGESKVDNTSAGGLAVGIDVKSSSLCKFAFYKPSFGGKTDIHPTSRLKFEGYKVPFLNEAIEMAKQLHSILNKVHSIGWDIAITSDGPVFIEGNDNWEITSIQACHRGLQKEFKGLFLDS